MHASLGMGLIGSVCSLHVFDSLCQILPVGHTVDKVVGAGGRAGGLRGEWSRPCVTVNGRAGGRR